MEQFILRADSGKLACIRHGCDGIAGIGVLLAQHGAALADFGELASL